MPTCEQRRRSSSSAVPLACLGDDELVARVRCGCDEAFAEIYRRYRGPLRAFAARMLRGTSHDADDVLQDAFIRAHRGLRVTSGAMTLRPWLYMIVRNQAIDVLRALQHMDSLDEGAKQLASVTCDPARCMSERDEMRDLVAQIGRLPERQRMALVLREFDGRSHAETARLLHTTVPATKSLLIRARSNLEATLRAA
jgi:RNA polymerase sigma factor (sigma-70 family)